MKKLALLAALALAGTANAATIDNFDNTGPFNLNAPRANAAVGSSSTGYTRTLTSATNGVDTNVQIDTATNPDVYAHSQSSGVSGTSYLEYTLLNLDLTAGFDNAFRVKLVSTDLNGVISVYASDGTNSNTVALNTNAIIIASGFAFPAYADFLFSSFAGVDFTSINTLRLGVNGNSTPALDVTIDQFDTVCSPLTASGGSGANPGTGNCTPPPKMPEPATLGLLGLGLAGVGVMRRRRQN